ncbi:hypothetical protein K438DRAFT_378618 [Mycena galopus ATCC 62051]|nr:hypothetical protein K438DRAFT_378618 [Mycena galopus ATCC 62051]
MIRQLCVSLVGITVSLAQADDLYPFNRNKCTVVQYPDESLVPDLSFQRLDVAVLLSGYFALCLSALVNVAFRNDTFSLCVVPCLGYALPPSYHRTRCSYSSLSSCTCCTCRL